MAQTVKSPPNAGDGAPSPRGEDPPEKELATHSRIRAGESQGQRSLAGCRPEGHRESATTEGSSRERHRRTEQTCGRVWWAGEGGTGGETSAETDTQTTQLMERCWVTRGAQPSAPMTQGRDGGMGGGRPRRAGTCAHSRHIHIVGQIPTQRCETIILQIRQFQY